MTWLWYGIGFMVLSYVCGKLLAIGFYKTLRILVEAEICREEQENEER